MIARLRTFGGTPDTIRKSDFFWPSLSLLVVILIVLTLGLTLIARQVDRTGALREQALVRHGLAQRILEVQQMILPQVVWDDAVRNLDRRYDAAWTLANIGKYLSQTDGIDRIFVIDANGQPKFAFVDGAVRSPDESRVFADTVVPLMRRVRGGERVRGILTAGRDAAMVGHPIQASALVRRQGSIWIVTASLVQPDFGTALPSVSAPVVVTAMQVDRRFLAQFAQRFILNRLKLDLSGQMVANGMSFIELRGPHGGTVATLSWVPQNAGRDMLRGVMAPTLTVIAVLGSAALLLIRRNQQMAERLIAGEAHTAHLAHHDLLTGLPNRLSLLDHLAKGLGEIMPAAGSVAVFCIDLDRFKEVNDCFGHHVGDQLLQTAARRLADVCAGEAMLARLSGDEFAVIQGRTSRDGAEALAARLASCMNEPVVLDCRRAFSSCSVGIALIDDARVDAGEALRRADLALYRAKNEGRNRYIFFDSAMDNVLKSRRALEADLHDAIVSDALSMAYQPQVNSNGAMTGVEALMRWNHPTMGSISPAVFIPLAEECGLIGEIGMFAFRRVFADASAWGDLKVAINVSANQLRMHDFIGDVRDMVRESGADPHRFELEITEGVLVGENPAIHATLAALHGMGFSIALDDFGTGYSSLSYLRKYPIDKIKIDRSFVVCLGVDHEADAVVGAIVKLARALKLGVIAEGVETNEQRVRLATVGCSNIQGFLYSRAIAPSMVAALIEAGGEWSSTPPSKRTSWPATAAA